MNTLILVNRQRLEALYGRERTAALMQKVQQLANHPRVNGVLIQVEQHPSVAAAYTAWLSDPTDPLKANAVSAAIRGVLLAFFDAGPNVHYVVIVGDDRVIPFRRVPEGPVDKQESHYVEHVASDSGVRSALAQNMVLTDDYYVDREPSRWQGRPLYLPDYGVGRLVETPEEIAGVIDQFLAEPTVVLDRALVTGYDFVQDSARVMHTMFDADGLTTDALIASEGATWSGDHLRALHLQATDRRDVQAINGHSTHTSTGTPDEKDITASEIVTATGTLAGAIVYAVGCHSGLNDPGVLDLAQAFARRRVTYVGNTGYGWGGSGIVYSEALMRNFTRELLRNTTAEVGPALARAKQRYYRSTFAFGPYDAKVLMEATLYGLPMLAVQSGGTLSEDDEFPSAAGAFSPPGFGGELNEGTLTFALTGTFGANEVPGQGQYPDLDGHTIFAAGAPVQPQFFADVSAPPAGTLRGLLFLGATYTDVVSYDPVIARPYNEYITDTSEPEFSGPGWWPPAPFALQNSDSVSATLDTVVLSLGQYSAAENTLRLYDRMTLRAFYSSQADITPPSVTYVVGEYDPAEKGGRIKVKADDPSDIVRVVVAFTRGDGTWESQDLPYDARTHRASGTVRTGPGTQFLVQVVDAAGNVAVIDNKGRYFTLASPLPYASPLPPVPRGYLPLVQR